MTNLFKKTLLVAALFTVAGAQAATTLNYGGTAVDTTNFPKDASAEAAAGKKLEVGVDTTLTLVFEDAAGKVAANIIALNDYVTINVAGATFDAKTGVPATLTGASGAVYTFRPALSTASSLVFQVTAIGNLATGGAIAADRTATLASIVLNLGSATGSLKLTANVSRTNQAAAVEATATTTPNVYNYKAQLVLPLATDLTALTGKISTGAARKGFSSGNRTLAVNLDDNRQYALAQPMVQLTLTVNADDLSYLGAADLDVFSGNANGSLSSGELSNFVKVTGLTSPELSLDAAKKVLTIKGVPTAPGAVKTDENVSVQFLSPVEVAGTAVAKAGAVAAASAIMPSTFTVSASGTTNLLVPALAYSATALTGAAAGSFTLDGSSTFVNYMPYGAGVSQILYATNNSSTDGKVMVSGYDSTGKKYGPYDLGTVKAQTVMQIAGPLTTKLTADGFTSGRIAFTVDTEAPNVVVYSAYNVNGTDRGLVTGK